MVLIKNMKDFIQYQRDHRLDLPTPKIAFPFYIESIGREEYLIYHTKQDIMDMLAAMQDA